MKTKSCIILKTDIGCCYVTHVTLSLKLFYFVKAQVVCNIRVNEIGKANQRIHVLCNIFDIIIYLLLQPITNIGSGREQKKIFFLFVHLKIHCLLQLGYAFIEQLQWLYFTYIQYCDLFLPTREIISINFIMNRFLFCIIDHPAIQLQCFCFFRWILNTSFLFTCESQTHNASVHCIFANHKKKIVAVLWFFSLICLLLN